MFGSHRLYNRFNQFHQQNRCTKQPQRPFKSKFHESHCSSQTFNHRSFNGLVLLLKPAKKLEIFINKYPAVNKIGFLDFQFPIFKIEMIQKGKEKGK